jgi:hypothetical protein
VKFFICGLLLCLIFPFSVKAADVNYVTLVFPVRGRDYWRQGKNINQLKNLTGLIAKSDFPSTWLLHYDALSDAEILSNLPAANIETGLFLEVTRQLADDSFVKFDWEHGNWSQANKIFLSGFTREERQRMIDKAFSAFKDKFGDYPKSYGAWYIDVWSMEYIRDKYQADIVLGLSDQYSTDGYQEWGQYINLPYFVSQKSAIEPAADSSDSTGVLKVQWAPRHPVLAYGSSVGYSNYSAQVNDYSRAKNLKSDYFRELLKSITIDVSGPISQAVIGIEAGELEDKYFPELEAQLNILKSFKTINNVTMKQFNHAYRELFNSVSPPATITATVSGTTVSWFMSPQMRYGVKLINNQKAFFDLRYYHASQYRDNDQLIPDTRKNLVRVVPALVDEVAFGRTVSSLLPRPSPMPIQKGHSVYGSYQGKSPLLKRVFTSLSTKIPDLVYSRLENQIYFGLRTGFETFVGLRLPKIKFGSFNFQFPILDNFISLKKKLTPHFTWLGKQELELKAKNLTGTVYSKGLSYGQDEITASQSGKMIWENSYYAIYVK